MKATSVAVVVLGLMGAWGATRATAAEEKPVINLEIMDHKFNPATVEVPAGTKFVLLVKNLDATPEEFESHDLSREVIVPGNGQKKVNLGPLKAGTYKFFGEFNQATAQGTLIAK